jgi:hypothetical protein
MPVPRSPAALAATLLLCSTALAQSGCAGIINRDPNLRWWAFKTYGTDRICPEILKASVPLKLNGESSPTIGRYYPSSCSTSINEEKRTVVVNIGGSGYAYMQPAKRVGFNLNVSPEYAFDFYMHDDGNWVWGKLSRVAAGPDFRMTNAENKVVDLANILTPAGGAANLFGSQIVSGFLSKGFTVVESDEGKEFTLGILPPGKRPFRPVEVDASDESYTFANDTADIYANQQDFLGPFEITDEDQRLSFRGTLTGGAVDFVIVSKQTGDQWRAAYQAGAPVSGAPGPIMGQSMVQAGPFTRKFELKPGFYYVVVDNSVAVGQASPLMALPNPLFDPSVRITYLAQLIEE